MVRETLGDFLFVQVLDNEVFMSKLETLSFEDVR